MNNFNSRYLCIMLAICAYTSYGHAAHNSPISLPPFYDSSNDLWVDSTLSTLSLEEKLGQLFIILSSNTDSKELASLINKNRPGGILLKDVSLHSYITAINKLRRESPIPLLEVSDQSLSVHNQFSNLPDLPSTATISAIHNGSLKQSLQYQLLSDLTTLGVNCSFSPNIHFHQQGESRYSLLNKEVNPAAIIKEASLQVTELEKGKILSILQGVKLFGKNNDLDEQFSYLKHNGLSGIYFDEQVFTGDQFHKKGPSFLKDLLQEKLQYKGLIIGELSEKATFIDFFYAGADVFVIPETELESTIETAKYLIDQKIIDPKLIDEKVRKILLAKSWLELDKAERQSIDRTTATSRLFPTPDSYLTELYGQATIVLPSTKETLPLATTFGKTRHIVHVSSDRLGTLQRTAFEYVNSNPHIYRPKKNGEVNPLAFNGTDEVYIVALDNIEVNAEKNKAFLNSIHQLAKENEVIIINFGNPLNLQSFSNDCTLLQLFEKNRYTEKLAIQVLFGSEKASGRLPVGISSRIHYDYSYKTELSRLKHTKPEIVGMSSEKLYRIDEIVEQAIRQRAMPGCQVLVAKDGNIIYSKGFGYHTYNKQQRVERSDLYDIASVTKAAATTLAMMKLRETGVAQLDKNLGSQMELPYGSNLRDITLTNLLIHKSGLQKNMPISTFLNNKAGTNCTTYFCDTQTDAHSQKIADRFYFNPQYQVNLWKSVNRLDRPSKYRHRKFLYSDVNFYVLQQFIEATTNKGLDEYVDEHFYKPLGLRYCLYNPLNRLPKYMIVPTQDDQKWRNALVRGNVHDETAALSSGVGGNAGLFSNAEDLAILFQMLLNGGSYGGKDYLKPSTIEHFTSAKHGNHRGLGFDKPLQTSTISRQASAATYGHILANRIHPEVDNRVLSRLGTRRKIHDAIYNAIDKTKQREETILVNIGGE